MTSLTDPAALPPSAPSPPAPARPRRRALLALLGAGAAGAVSAVQPVVAQAQTAAGDFVRRTGDTMTGSLRLVSRPGDESRDTTSRLTVESYQMSYKKPYGEGIRMMLNTSTAKNMIAWYDAFTTPSSPKAIAWVGAHYGTYVKDLIHKHWSVETSDAKGALHSRFTITYGEDLTVSRFNATHLQHTASQGGRVWMTVSPGLQKAQERALIFATGVYARASERRWSISADTTAESGTATGSDLVVRRFSNAGKLLSTPIRISRANGRISTPHDLEFTTSSRGVLLRSPNGTRWRLVVDDRGRLGTRKV